MAASSYVLWGVFPIYFHWLREVNAAEILAHRIIWSALLLVLFGVLARSYPWRRVFTQKKLLPCLLSALFLSVNWLIYIWAIGNQKALEGSLGYFINPLVSVLLAVVVLNESLSRYKILSIALAGIAVLYLALKVGEIPWIALSLALAFGSYGLIHKLFEIDAIGGLTMETILLAPFALFFLGYLHLNGQMAFLSLSPSIDVLLVCAGPVTTIPLLLYLKGLAQLRLTTAALMQYIVPSLQFLVAVYILLEPLSNDKLLAFCLIWLALAIYSLDVLQQRRRNNRIRQNS